MTRFQSQPPWEFLLTASKASLQSYELSRLSLAANLRKEVSTILDQWLQESTMAALARLLIEQRERAPEPATAALTVHAPRSNDRRGRINGAHTASYNIFADEAESSARSEAND